MKRIDEFKLTRNALMAEADKIKSFKSESKEDKRRLRKIAAELPEINLCIRYLEANPSSEVMNEMLARVEKRMQAINDEKERMLRLRPPATKQAISAFEKRMEYSLLKNNVG